MDRKEEMLQLLKEKKTYKEIGKLFKISRQRVHQILQKEFGQELLTNLNPRLRNGFKNYDKK